MRHTMFGGRLSQEQVDGMSAILDSCEKHGVLLLDPLFPGALLGTAYGEVGSGMQPVREGFAKSDAEARAHVRAMYERGRISYDYAVRDINGRSYYGRGFVQLTHKRNYRRLGKRLGLPLADDPDLALLPRVAADVLVVGCMEGLFTGHSLSDHLPGDLIGARQVVNGHDRAREFASYTRAFAAAIRDSKPQAVAQPH